MTRFALEHIIRASGTITSLDDMIIIGSQSILGAFPNAPAELLVSEEADIYPRENPEQSELIEGSIGEGSPFQKTFGYYADGVSENTATLPDGWRERLILIFNPNTRGVRGWCLEPHDLAISKYVAGREKDLAFTAALARHQMVRREILEERLAATTLDPRIRELVAARIHRDHSAVVG